MQKIEITKARAGFARLIESAFVQAERTVLLRHGRAVAAVVTVDDLQRLEALEDEADAQAVAEALAEQGNRPAEAWEGVKTRLGLGNEEIHGKAARKSNTRTRKAAPKGQKKRGGTTRRTGGQSHT